jgi:hypothetical protein
MSEDKLNIQEEIMLKIKSGQVKMKPRWYFVLGSIAMVSGLAGLTIASVFLIGLISFSLRTHGPMGPIRFQIMLNNFPLWAVGLATIGICVGVWMLKKYDFSYKKNFPLIIIGFILSIIIAGYIIDFVGINESLRRRERLRMLYQKQSAIETTMGNCDRI